MLSSQWSPQAVLIPGKMGQCARTIACQGIVYPRLLAVAFAGNLSPRYCPLLLGQFQFQKFFWRPD